jgi:hypothetical protein
VCGACVYACVCECVCACVCVCVCGCLQHNLPPLRCRVPHTIMATAAASAHAPHPRRRSGPALRAMTRQKPRTKYIAAASSRVSQNWSWAWRTRRRAERPRARPRAPRAMRKSTCRLSTRRLPASPPLSRCTCPPNAGRGAACVDVCRICCGVSPVSPCRMSLGGTASCDML